MKFASLLVPALSLCALTVVAQARQSSQPEITKHTLHFAGSGPHVLEVRTISGEIHVEGYDGKDVEMTVRKSITADTADDFQRAQRDVVLEIADNALTVGASARYSKRPSCGEKSEPQHDDWPRYEVRFDFTIRVPRDTQLTLCTINIGHVTVNGTRANFQVHSVNGRIEMTDMGGSGEATTVNGRIVGTFAAAPKAASNFKTVNGDIVLTMPDAFAAQLNMKTFNGGLFTDFESQPLTLPPAVAPKRKGDKFVYEGNPFAAVRVGSGGPVLTMDTLNGDVRVLRVVK